MDIPGGCLEVVEVTMDNRGFETGIITASWLFASFDFEGGEVASLHLWLHGPCVLVYFQSTTHLLDVYPLLTIIGLRSVLVPHSLTFSHVAMKRVWLPCLPASILDFGFWIWIWIHHTYDYLFTYLSRDHTYSHES
jgi:hypothetical protein